MSRLLLSSFLATIFISVFTLQSSAEKITFRHGTNTLAGEYLLPENGGGTRAVILFVHGDGPTTFDADGFYPLIWDTLRKHGYAILSWDKAGVGDSTGNWLHQSMTDRQAELRSAIKFVQTRYGYTGRQTGLMGFSQAGWVVPAVAQNNPDVGFVIGVGFAINWQEQGWYFTKKQLQAEGASPDDIETAHAAHNNGYTFLKTKPSYQDYITRGGNEFDLMSEDRFQFALKNYDSDASNDYRDINQPILMLLGGKDLNVDVQDTYKQVVGAFKGRDNLTISVLPDSTHGLLQAEYFNEQNPGFWFIARLVWMEEEAFDPEFFPTLLGWLDKLPSKKK